MFIIPYHVKMKLKSFGKFLLILGVILLIVSILLFIWLERYIVYTEEGLYFDYERSTSLLVGKGVEITPTENTDPIKIVYDDSGDSDSWEGLRPIMGYYADTKMILHNLDEVRTQIEALPPGSAVMLDVKSDFGNFYYSTKISGASTSDSVDIAAMDDLIEYLDKSGLYLIARVPAFCDYNFALAHQNSGLPLSSGALWMDDNSCYWLDPTSATVLNNLSAIAGELSDLGFDEVVFTQFLLPQSDRIVYDMQGRSAQEIIGGAAENLVNAFMGQRIVVSFCSADPAFPIPSGTSRLFLTDVGATQAEGITESTTSLTDPAVQLVFVTDSRDTRFDTYNVLRTFTVAGD